MRYLVAVLVVSVSVAQAKADPSMDALHACFSKEDSARQALKEAGAAYEAHRVSLVDLARAMDKAMEVQTPEWSDRCFAEEKQKRGVK